MRRLAPSWVSLALLGAAAVSAFALPVLAVKSPQDVRLEPLTARELPSPALFSHWRHAQQHCYACHPSLFPQTARGFTHAQMREARHCGACHDGARASAITSMACEACHVPR